VLGNILLRSVLFVILLQSCSSLNDSEIQNLTTCKASIKEIRRRLLKVGASLTADEKDFLRTDYSYFNFGFKYKTAFFIDNASSTTVSIKTMGKMEGHGPGYPIKFLASTRRQHGQIKNHLCNEKPKAIKMKGLFE
jgi:hypothetical protein